MKSLEPIWEHTCMKICHPRYVIRQGMGYVKLTTKSIISIGVKEDIMRYTVTRKDSWGSRDLALSDR